MFSGARAFWVDTREECLLAADIRVDHAIEIEAAPSKHAIVQGFFLYGIEPGGNRVEVTAGGRFVFAPDEPCPVSTEAERAKGPGVGRRDGGVPLHLRHPAGPPARLRARWSRPISRSEWGRGDPSSASLMPASSSRRRLAPDSVVVVAGSGRLS